MAATHQRASHSILVTGADSGVEAWFPRVREVPNLSDRLATFRDQKRAYALLDLPTLTVARRLQIARNGLSYVGRFYDIGQVVLFALTGRFWSDGAGTLVCSRLVTAAYFDARENLFDAEVLGALPPDFPRCANLAQGWVTPGDLLYSRLVVREFVPSATAPTPNALARTP
jgi:hypothetical protein